MTLTRRQIDTLLIERQIARDYATFSEADRIRDLLAAHGVTVTDTPDGQVASHGTEAELRQAQAALAAAHLRIAEQDKHLEAMRNQVRGTQEHTAKLVDEGCALRAEVERLTTEYGRLATAAIGCRDELERCRRLRPLSEWHEDYGAVTWWKFPLDEPAWIGTPLDSDWPGYHTHWTLHPAAPAKEPT